MEIIFVCNGNSLNTKIGSTGFCSDRLSETGVFQSLKLAKKLKDIPIDFVFCSDIGYRRTTTDYIVQELSHQDFQIHVDPRVREKNAENCSHLIKEFLNKQEETETPANRVVLDRLFIKSDLSIDQPLNNETDNELTERASSFISFLLKTYPSNSTLLIVGSRVINSFMIKLLLRSNDSHKSFEMDDAAISWYQKV